MIFKLFLIALGLCASVFFLALAFHLFSSYLDKKFHEEMRHIKPKLKVY